MKSLLLITAAIATVTAAAAASAEEVRLKLPGSGLQEGYYMVYIPAPSGRTSQRQVESHDAVRAHAADPTHQYDLPDWARAAFSRRR